MVNDEHEQHDSDKIEWAPLEEMPDEASGVYLLIWGDGVMKFGASQNIHARAETHHRTKRQTSPDKVHLEHAFGYQTSERHAAERALRKEISFGSTEWVVPDEPMQVVTETNGLRFKIERSRSGLDVHELIKFLGPDAISAREIERAKQQVPSDSFEALIQWYRENMGDFRRPVRSQQVMILAFIQILFGAVKEVISDAEELRNQQVGNYQEFYSRAHEITAADDIPTALQNLLEDFGHLDFGDTE